MSLRKRLRKRGYVLMSVDRVNNIVNLRRQVSDGRRAQDKFREHNQTVAYELETRTNEQAVAMDLLEAKYKIALKRIARLEALV